MATNFYTYYAIMNEKKILELCQTRKEANDSMPFWAGRKGGTKITKVTFEAVCLMGKIYIPAKYNPDYPMWLKSKWHGVEYAYNIT